MKLITLAECTVGKPKYGANAPGVDYHPDLPRYIRITDIDEHGRLKKVGLKCIHKKVSNDYLLKKGDFLFARSGATAGKTYLHQSNDEDFVYAGYLIRFRLNQEKLSPEFLEQFTRSERYWHWVRAKIHTGAQPNLNALEYLELPVPCPPLEIQKKTVTLLSLWDKTIEKMENLIEAKALSYRYYLSSLINNQKHSYGSVGDVTVEISTRNINEECQRVLSVTNHSGFVLPEKQFERQVASDNLGKYKLIKPGQYAYNPSRLNVGSIARLDDFDESVLSPMYVVFKLEEEKINSDFFLHWLFSHEARQQIKKNVWGGVRNMVRFKDFRDILIPIPPLEEQKEIAWLLNSMRREVDLLNRQLENYHHQKRGLMQKLFPG